MSLKEETGELIVTRCWCGLQHAVPESLYREKKRCHDAGSRYEGIYCPLGHQWLFSREPAHKRHARELEAEKRRTTEVKLQRDRAQREANTNEARRRAEKAAKTRLKNRVAAGVCPCCNRTFKQLARHMKSQHPDFSATQEAPSE